MILRLKRFFDVRPGEGLPVLMTFLYFAVVVASFLLAKPIRNGLFLSRYGAYKLAYVYVGVPVVLSLFVPFYTRIAARVGQRLVIVGTLIFFCLNVLVFWYLFRFHRFGALSAAFYIWVNCFAVIAPVQAWTFVNSVFNTRQAKRLFGLIGSGASLGAITGGLLAVLLVKPVGGTENLLLVLAALIALAAVIVTVAWRVVDARAGFRPDPRRRVPFRDTLRIIVKTRYLTLIATVVVLVAIVTQWTQFQFSLAAEQRFAGDPDRLTQFFGKFNVYLGIVAFSVQLLLTGTVLRRFGIAFTILVLPIALGLGSSLIVLAPLLWAVLLTSGLDQALRFSIDKATFELLYLPLPSNIRTNVKVTIDTVINRCADAVGGVGLGLATQGFNFALFELPGAGFGLRGTAAVNLVLIGLWMVVGVALRRGYVAMIRDSIRDHRLRAEQDSAVVLDRSTTDVLASTLREGKPDDILYALSFFETQHGHVTHPALQHLLLHPTPQVRARALALLRAAGDRSVLARVEAMLEDPDLATRTEALLYLAYVAHEDPLVRISKLGEFPDYSVRAAVISCLAQPGRIQNLDAARLILDTMVGETGAAGLRARLEAARLIGAASDEVAGAFEDPLGRLLRDESEEVVRAAVTAAKRVRTTAFVDRLLELLADPAMSDDAAEALAQCGDPIVPALRDRLFDEATPVEVRREIPGALLRIGTAAAQRALAESLLNVDPSLRLRILISLNKLRKARPDIQLDLQVVETLLGAEIIGHYRSHQILGTLTAALRSDDDSAMSALKHSMGQEVERIFRLTGLLYPEHDLHSAYVGLQSTSATVRANALEFLDNVLKPPLRSLLVPLLDTQITTADRMAMATHVVGASVASEEEAVAALLGSEDAWLRSCAAYAIGALRLKRLEPALDRWLEDPDALLRETARAAKARLTAQEPAVAPAPDAEAPPPPPDWEERTRTLGMG